VIFKCKNIIIVPVYWSRCGLLTEMLLKMQVIWDILCCVAWQAVGDFSAFTLQVKQFKKNASVRTAYHWRWRHCDPLKHHKLLSWQYSFTSYKTFISWLFIAWKFLWC